MAGAFADLSSLVRLLCTCAITHEKHTWNQPSGTAFIQTMMTIRHLPMCYYRKLCSGAAGVWNF